MAKPQQIEYDFTTLSIVAIEDNNRPELSISGKQAAMEFAKSSAKAPMTSPKAI
jgi:hypothetical protein